MGCCGSKDDDEDSVVPTERTRLLKDVLDPGNASINGPGGMRPSGQPSPSSAERQASYEAVARDIEDRLQDIVARTEANLITIGDSEMVEELPATIVSERQKAYAVYVREAAGPPTGMVLPLPSAQNKQAVPVLSAPPVSEADHAMVAKACAELAAAYSEMEVEPVEADIVIDFSSLKMV